MNKPNIVTLESEVRNYSILINKMGRKNSTACPCCGYQTLSSRDDFEICDVCLWEDDGSDNFDRSQVAIALQGLTSEEKLKPEINEEFIEHAGPNGVPLVIARINFINFGISEPDRNDLFKLKKDPNQYKKIREFFWDEKTRTLSEPAANWSIKLAN